MNYSEFKTWVDMPKFAGVCNEICHATVLNESTNRMMKEKFILGALQRCNTANNIEWTDARDFDVKFLAWDQTVEVKTGNEPMFSAKTGKPKKQVSLKLKNVYESRNQRKTLDKTFDHLMIVQIKGRFAVGFVDFATVNQHLVPLTDGFLVKMPFSTVNMIYEQDMRSVAAKWNIDFDPKNWVLSQLTSAGC
jgi:hypothetical protein